MMRSCGIFTWFGFVYTMQEKLQMIKDAGFSGVILWWGNEFSELDGNYMDLPEKCDRFGLTAENAHIPYFGANRLWQDNLDGEEIVKKYASLIKDAGDTGLDTLVVHPFDLENPFKQNETLCKERFKRLGDIAGNAGVRLAVENLNENAILSRIIHYADNEYVGLCFDSGHDNVHSGENFALLREFSDRLYAVHIHDNNGKQDEHILPYEGNIDWAEYNHLLNQTNYKKSFVLESAYPFDYDEYGESVENDENAVFIDNRELSAPQYLKKAYESCIRVMNEKYIPES